MKLKPVKATEYSPVEGEHVLGYVSGIWTEILFYERMGYATLTGKAAVPEFVCAMPVGLPLVDLAGDPVAQDATKGGKSK